MIIIFTQLNLNSFNRIFHLISQLWSSVVTQTCFLPVYYKRNENMWVDGFLIDFLQKKSSDLFVRKFVIFTGFLFSERLAFDAVVRIYIDNLTLPLQNIGILESDNVSSMLNTMIYLYFLSISLFVCYLIISIVI